MAHTRTVVGLITEHGCYFSYFVAVEPVCRQGVGVRIGGRGRPLEYILEMVRLRQDKMMDEVATRGELTGEVMDRLVARLVPFYRDAATGAHINRFGEPGVISYNHEENFALLKPLVGELLTPGLFREIQDYARSFLIVKGDLFRRRTGGAHPGLPRRFANEEHLPGGRHLYLRLH